MVPPYERTEESRGVSTAERFAGRGDVANAKVGEYAFGTVLDAHKSIAAGRASREIRDVM